MRIASPQSNHLPHPRDLGNILDTNHNRSEAGVEALGAKQGCCGAQVAEGGRVTECGREGDLLPICLRPVSMRTSHSGTGVALAEL